MSNQKLVNGVASGLAWELKYIRKACGMTLDDVCLKLKWPLSKLSRMEGGQQCISEADLASVLVLYQVHGKERQRLLHLAERQDDPGRWETYLPQTVANTPLFRLELEASALVDAEPLLIPGLAQTADYARASMRAGYVLPEQIEARVEGRMMRQKILTQKNSPKLDLIVDEIALRRVVGSHKIMAAQLRSMLETAELPNVRLWVMPFELGGNAFFVDPFYLMDFPKSRSVVLLEGTASSVFLEAEDKIEFFRRHATKLTKVALNPAESVDFVATLATEHDRE
ncbi:MAG TPA: helix-turn-helix transcriptional regulator [Pseudonocardiaceae bacterium]|nr:helix-turn-helix transcriptional regulator [Pseudonocardiaceae bacterium]